MQNNKEIECVVGILKGMDGEDILYDYDAVTKLLQNVRKAFDRVVPADKDKVLLEEALYSARIEGSQSTLDSITGILENRIAGEPNRDDQMVLNVMRAMNFAVSYNITEQNIRRIWELLTHNVLNNSSISGKKWRSEMVYLTGNGTIRHTPEKPDNIEKRMKSLFEYVNGDADPIIKAIVTQFYFEYVYPFCDGNGCFGRMWAFDILRKQLSYNVNFVSISQKIWDKRSEYYNALVMSEVPCGSKIDVTPFLVFMLEVLQDAACQNGSL